MGVPLGFSILLIKKFETPNGNLSAVLFEFEKPQGSRALSISSCLEEKRKAILLKLSHQGSQPQRQAATWQGGEL